MKNDQLAFYVNPSHKEQDVEHILTAEEMEKVLADEEKFFQQEAEDYLNRYHRVKRMVANTRIPSITSTWSDMPSSSGGTPNSKVEEYAIKSVSAQEWIDVFESALNTIEYEHKAIIVTKYLESYYPRKDDYVFDRLCISRSTYYRTKPAALEEFGRALHEFFYYYNSHSKEG